MFLLNSKQSRGHGKKFLLGDEIEGHKLHSISQNATFSPLKKGRLGMRSLGTANKGLLGEFR